MISRCPFDHLSSEFNHSSAVGLLRLLIIVLQLNYFVMNLCFLSACVIVAVAVVVSGAVRQRHVSIGCLQYLLS